MPVSKRQFEEGKLLTTVEEEILSFLKERKEGAFTSQEIMAGIRYPIDFSTPEISKISAFAIADFTTFLHNLVNRGTVGIKVVSSRMYFMAKDSKGVKCPRCSRLFEPKKSWKMAGRPDRKGKRLQLHIGLFMCPMHGTFRKVLDKKRI